MKKINMNNFVIDDVFKKLDKKAKRKKEKSLKTKSDNKSESDLLVIEINV